MGPCFTVKPIPYIRTNARVKPIPYTNTRVRPIQYIRTNTRVTHSYKPSSHRPQLAYSCSDCHTARHTARIFWISASGMTPPFFRMADANSSTVMVPLLSLSMSRKISRMPLISSTGRFRAITWQMGRGQWGRGGAGGFTSGSGV